MFQYTESILEQFLKNYKRKNFVCFRFWHCTGQFQKRETLLFLGFRKFFEPTAKEKGSQMILSWIYNSKILYKRSGMNTA